MAPRTSSKRYASSPPLPRKSYVEQVESAEVKRSRKAAILQLKMGRLAHIIGIASGLALALTAVIAYGLINWDFLNSGPEFLTSFKWLIPLIAGLVVSIVALMIKWEPYLTDRRDAHFIMSIVAVIVPSLLIVLIALDEIGYFTLGRPDWLYSASLLGISLTLISLAMTWEGTSRRRTISIVSAVFPPVLLFFPVVFKFNLDVLLSSLLPMAYLGSAVAIQLSGSMLHIIASSTTVQQREVLRASDGKLKEQLIELDKKRKALIYREDALRSKESDLEIYERKLQDELASLEERKSQTTLSESDIEERLRKIQDERQRLSKQAIEIENQRDILNMRQAELDAQGGDLAKMAKSFETREGAISARERDANRILLEAQSKERDVKNRTAEVEAQEASLQALRKELEGLQAKVSEKEKELGVRETQLDLRGLEARLAKEQAGQAKADEISATNLEVQLLAKQQELSEREIALKGAQEDIRQKSEKAERLISRADKQMNELVDKETSMLAREKELASKEADLRAAAAALNSQLEEVSRSRAAMSSKEKQYEEFAVNTRTRLSTIDAREEEIARKMTALEKREQKIKELNEGLTAEKERMNAKLRELLEKEKDLHAEETELGLKQAELKVMERDILESVDEVEEVRMEEVPEEDEREKALEFREKRLTEREQEVKSRLYQREKELEKKEQSLRARVVEDLEGKEEAVQEEYAEEKVKTGMERLDDLLMGGMPFGSTVLFVGPPFIGKEVAMLLFLAEGLRKGVPAVIVTTSHPPSEISKEMAPILPTFMELQQLGMVRWIDASGVEDPQGITDTSVVRVNGPGDFVGITDALDRCVKDFQRERQPYFRLAYMSLSLSMTQSNEKEAFQFVQATTAKVKLARAVSVFAVERGMHTEQQLESVQHLMTGAVQFKTDKQKTLLSVQGIGEAQTRDWVEYKHTGKALMIGAFSLERIR